MRVHLRSAGANGFDDLRRRERHERRRVETTNSHSRIAQTIGSRPSKNVGEIKVTVVPGTRGRCVYVDLRAEAGTYIKEFCHGDKGRTNPSLSDLLERTKCDIIQLDVTKADAVGFDDQNFKRSSSSDK